MLLSACRSLLRGVLRVLMVRVLMLSLVVRRSLLILLVIILLMIRLCSVVLRSSSAVPMR